MISRVFRLTGLLLLLGYSACAKDRVPAVEEIVLPREIFTGEVFHSAEEYQKIADSIVLRPSGGRLSKEQFSNLIGLLSALDAVAKSAKVQPIFLSSESDAFLSAKVTLSKRRGWSEFEEEAVTDDGLVEVSALVQFAQDKKR